MLAHEVKRGAHGYGRTIVTAHAVNGDSNHPAKGVSKSKRKGRQFPVKENCLPNTETLLAGTLGDLLATVITGWADVVAQMNFTGRWLHSQRRVGQKIVRTMHAAL